MFRALCFGLDGYMMGGEMEKSMGGVPTSQGASKYSLKGEAQHMLSSTLLKLFFFFFSQGFCMVKFGVESEN